MKMTNMMTLALLCGFVSCLQAGNVHTNGVVVMEMADAQTHEETPTPTIQDTQRLEGTAHSTLSSEGNIDQCLKVDGTEAKGSDVDIVINLDRYVNNVGPMFVGVTLDSSVFRREWNSFNTSSRQLQSLARGLAPSFLRVGGSAADFFIFEATANVSEETDNDEYDVDKPVIKNFTVTGKQWKQLNDFVQEVGWDLIFDFNQFLRKGDSWDPDNARELLTFSQEQNLTIHCFQLGNEPNSYHHNFNFSIPGARLAKDMEQLRSLLTEFPAYHNSYIIGPDVTKVTKQSASNYLKEFLKSGGQTVVAAVTLHHYYFNVKTHGARVDDFYNATILNSLKSELSTALSISHALAPELPLWFSETSSVSGGGLEGVSDGYAAGFMWLDKLGLSALSGLKVVARQSFFRGNYALISDDYFPYPDYFLTVLYKRLAQGPVFNVTSSTDTVRMYAICANPLSYQKGALTVYILNVGDTPTTLNFTQFIGYRYELYLLTPGDEKGLTSKFVALNGEKLVMVNEDLPPLHPLICTGRIMFPAHSFGFVVIPQADVKFCSEM
ncbi:heparanase-like [Babylonia areolata]|uniref:heparanase-like n=1 Tax=Babylonia areolata TaxID=304850 RepID=UPI003FD0B8FA